MERPRLDVRGKHGFTDADLLAKREVRHSKIWTCAAPVRVAETTLYTCKEIVRGGDDDGGARTRRHIYI